MANKYSKFGLITASNSDCRMSGQKKTQTCVQLCIRYLLQMREKNLIHFSIDATEVSRVRKKAAELYGENATASESCVWTRK